MNVADYMTTPVVTANLRDGLHQTFHRMRERGIRHMPVVGEREELVGMITDRDLRRPDFVDADPNTTAYYRLDNSILVKDAMTSDPIAMRPQDNVTDAIAVFVTRKFGALPVIDEERRLVGVLSAWDLLRAFSDHLSAR